jgi:hypothetical protein
LGEKNMQRGREKRGLMQDKKEERGKKKEKRRKKEVKW